MKTSFFAILLAFMSLFTTCLFGQSRWMTIYYENENAIGNTIANSYDKGILVVGKHGYNAVSYNWLIKTDINGEILWNKTIGDISSNIKISAISYNDHGELIMAGLTGYYSSTDYDPFVMKLNKCGEKEWCRVFVEEDNNYSNAIKGTDDGGCVVLLRYMNPDATKDRICLAKLSSNGEQIWNHCYNSTDTSLENEDAYDLLLCPDGGFLITGRCYYEDMNPPHYFWAKPYFIKTDSLGNFEWETVVHSDTIEPGGAAWSTILSPDSNFFYSFISHYYHNPTQNAPALVKMDLQGQVIGVYDLAEKDDLGKLFQATFINDSILAGSASWGSEGYSSPKAVLFDTLGNMLDSTFLVDNHYLSYVRKTFDNKLLFFTNKYDGELDEFDAYLFKLNKNLDGDTLYSQYFNYDSLCPYQIISDTIVQDNCGLIVGMEEVKPEKEEKQVALKIYPNPTKSIFNISIPGLNENEFTNSTCIIEIFDIYGRKVKERKIPKGQNTIEVNVSGWRKGLYLVRMRTGQSIVGSEKVVVN